MLEDFECHDRVEVVAFPLEFVNVAADVGLARRVDIQGNKSRVRDGGGVGSALGTDVQYQPGVQFCKLTVQQPVEAHPVCRPHAQSRNPRPHFLAKVSDHPFVPIAMSGICSGGCALPSWADAVGSASSAHVLWDPPTGEGLLAPGPMKRTGVIHSHCMLHGAL